MVNVELTPKLPLHSVKPWKEKYWKRTQSVKYKNVNTVLNIKDE